MSKTHIIIPILKQYGIIDVLPKIRYYVKIYEKQLRIERNKEIEKDNKIRMELEIEERNKLQLEYLVNYFQENHRFPMGFQYYKGSKFHFCQRSIRNLFNYYSTKKDKDN